MADLNSLIWAYDVYMIGPLAKFFTASIRLKPIKDILVRFNVSQMCVYYNLIG